MDRMIVSPQNIVETTSPLDDSNGNDTRWARLAFIAILLIIYLFGSYAALKSPIVQDTEQEQNVLRVDLKAISGLLHGETADYMTLQDFGDKYYGIGFDAPAYPIQALLYPLVARALEVDNESAFLLVKQWLSFNLFFASGILVFLLSHRILHDAGFARIASVAYLLWPFLLGHSACNIKDVPFLFAWLLCTHTSFILMASGRLAQPSGRNLLLMLGICTGWLISIRIAGILIFLQYALTIACAWRCSAVRSPILPPTGNLILGLGACLAIIMLGYPVAWSDPRQIIAAIQYMGHHPMAFMGVCSLVYGVCLPIAGSPVLYLPAWLSVKLPIAIIAGVLLLPLALRKAAKRNAVAGLETGQSFVLSLFLTVLLIPSALIVGHAILYHDLRHVLFLLPLFFLCGVVALYWLSRRIAITLLTIAIVTFGADNFLSFPYQYIWFNEAARLAKIDNAFDTDYWGSAAGNAYARLLHYARTQPPVQCLYGDHEVLFRHVRPDTFGCVRMVEEFKADAPRPLLIVALSNQVRPPPDCIEVDSEKSRLLLGNGPIHLRRIWHCR